MAEFCREGELHASYFLAWRERLRGSATARFVLEPTLPIDRITPDFWAIPASITCWGFKYRSTSAVTSSTNAFAPVANYRDTFRLLLRSIQRDLGVEPATLTIAQLDQPRVLGFLETLE